MTGCGARSALDWHMASWSMRLIRSIGNYSPVHLTICCQRSAAKWACKRKLSCLIPGVQSSTATAILCLTASALFRADRAAWKRRITPFGPRLARARWASIRPCMGLWKSRGRHHSDLLSNGAYQFLGSAEGVSSSRPRFCEAPRAAVVKAGPHCGGAASCVVSRRRLDDGEPGAKLDGRDDRS